MIDVSISLSLSPSLLSLYETLWLKLYSSSFHLTLRVSLIDHSCYRSVVNHICHLFSLFVSYLGYDLSFLLFHVTFVWSVYVSVCLYISMDGV